MKTRRETAGLSAGVRCPLSMQWNGLSSTARANNPQIGGDYPFRRLPKPAGGYHSNRKTDRVSGGKEGEYEG